MEYSDNRLQQFEELAHNPAPLKKAIKAALGRKGKKGRSWHYADNADLLQDVLLALWQSLPEYDSTKSAFITWACNKARYITLYFKRMSKSEGRFVSLTDIYTADMVFSKTYGKRKKPKPNADYYLQSR